MKGLSVFWTRMTVELLPMSLYTQTLSAADSLRPRDGTQWCQWLPMQKPNHLLSLKGGGPRVVVSTAAFKARVRGSVPGLGGLKETKLFLPHPRVKVSIVGSLRDREVACSASDRQDSNFESCVRRTVSSQSSHHPQEVLLAQFSLYVHKGGLKPDSFHLLSLKASILDFNLNQIGLVLLRYIVSYIGTDLVNLKIKWYLSNRILKPKA